jgi:hypothetical protein
MTTRTSKTTGILFRSSDIEKIEICDLINSKNPTDITYGIQVYFYKKKKELYVYNTKERRNDVFIMLEQNINKELYCGLPLDTAL